jgi:hypothetical protein
MMRSRTGRHMELIKKKVIMSSGSACVGGSTETDANVLKINPLWTQTTLKMANMTHWTSQLVTMTMHIEQRRTNAMPAISHA